MTVTAVRRTRSPRGGTSEEISRLGGEISRVRLSTNHPHRRLPSTVLESSTRQRVALVSHRARGASLIFEDAGEGGGGGGGGPLAPAADSREGFLERRFESCCTTRRLISSSFVVVGGGGVVLADADPVVSRRGARVFHPTTRPKPVP